MDYTTLTDDELEQTRLDVANEQDRRARVAQTPNIVKQLAEQFTADGGDITVLQDAVAPMPVNGGA